MSFNNYRNEIQNMHISEHYNNQCILESEKLYLDFNSMQYLKREKLMRTFQAEKGCVVTLEIKLSCRSF